MKTFKQIVENKYIGLVLEDKGNKSDISIGEYEGIKFSINHSKKHDFYKRLDRVNMKLSDFTKLIPKIIKCLEDNNFKQGRYAIDVMKNGVLKFIIIMKYNKNDAFIITLLSNNMKKKDFDWGLTLYEWLREYYNISNVEENSISIVEDIINNDKKEDLIIENFEGDISISGRNLFIDEIFI